MRSNRYQPDDLVLNLASHLGQVRDHIAGLHLFIFNQVEATQSWRAGFLNDFRQQKSRERVVGVGPG